MNYIPMEKQDIMLAQWILLVLEDGRFPDESICYAIKLARRMDCSISIIMLSGNTNDEVERSDDIRNMMKHTIDIIITEGIHAEGNFVYGDKASELLKHLALNRSLSAIVWGGNEAIGKGLKKKRDYWFKKVKSFVQCPVVRPEIKDKSRTRKKKSAIQDLS